MHTVLMVSLALLLTGWTGCAVDPDPVDPPLDDRGTAEVTLRWDSIRSMPGGGGLFVGTMRPGPGFDGTVRLRLEGDARLGASLSASRLGAADTVFEVRVRPFTDVPYGRLPLTLVAAHGDSVRRYPLAVEVMHWQAPSAAEAVALRDRFRSWIIAQRPDLTDAFDAPVFVYTTYPEILIVEHYTLLTPRYEVRVCSHVMVPPDDWMKLSIRPRDRSLPAFAAHRASDGTITTLPPCAYPTLFGY